MKLRHILLIATGTLLLSACNMTLASDVTPPPGYVPPTPAPTLGPLYPNQAPDVVNGEVIYTEKCAPCHGNAGLGDGPQSADLPVSVIPIGLPEFANEASLSDWYAVVTQGRLDRFMPPFASLSDQERWDVVAYALTLHTTNDQLELGKKLLEENCADCGQSFTNLQMMSALSEDDLVKFIREGQGSFPAFGKDFSDDEAYAVAAYIHTLAFAAPAAPVAAAPTETPVAAETESTPAAEETAVDGTPQAEVTPEATEVAAEVPAVNVIKGQIDNQTGEALPADLKVTLRGFDHGSDPSLGPQEIVTLQGDVNADGSFSFETDFVENEIYLAEVNVGGLKYQSEFAVVPADTNEVELSPIVVYPTTDDLSILNVEELQIYFDFAGEDTQIFAVYFITNSSDKTVMVEMSDGQNIPFIAFPEGATALGFETTNDTSFTSTDNGFAIPPSENPYGLIAFASIPKAKESKIVQPILMPVHSIALFLPEGVTASGTSLMDNGVQALQGTNFQVYTAAGLDKDSSFEFTISGEPATVSQSPDLTQNQTVLIGIGGLGIALIVAGIWMYIRDKRRGTDDEDELDGEDEDDDEYEDSESIMDAIIALDDLHRAGKITDEAYKKRREELTNALKRKG